MIYLSEETSSQENMEAWFSQLSDPEFPLVKDSVFHGYGDNHKLLTIPDVFRNWAES